MTFQGGFVGIRCSIEARMPSQLEVKKVSWQNLTCIYPEDVNRRQTFDLEVEGLTNQGVESIKLVFEESSDFFGRITVYDLKIEGLIL